MSDTQGQTAGWYPDPTRPGMERWFDGAEWQERWQPATAPAPRRARWLIPAVLAVVVLIVGGAASAAVLLGGDKSHTIEGTIVLHDVDRNWWPGDGCSGDGGYDDLKYGAQVLVSDADGTLLAKGALDLGKADSAHDCVFPFEVADVKDADFYQLKVSHRAAPTYSKADMQSNDWTIDLTIGGD